MQNKNKIFGSDLTRLFIVHSEIGRSS